MMWAEKEEVHVKLPSVACSNFLRDVSLPAM